MPRLGGGMGVAIKSSYLGEGDIFPACAWALVSVDIFCVRILNWFILSKSSHSIRLTWPNADREYIPMPPRPQPYHIADARSDLL